MADEFAQYKRGGDDEFGQFKRSSATTSGAREIQANPPSIARPQNPITAPAGPQDRDYPLPGVGEGRGLREGLAEWEKAGPGSVLHAPVEVARGNVARGTHQLLSGLMNTAAPAAPFAVAAAPGQAALGTLGGTALGKIGHASAEAIGASPDVSDVVEDVGNIAGGWAGSRLEPKATVTSPVRIGARTLEGAINSSPARYVRGAARLFTPADEARKMIRIPGRDLGLTKPEPAQIWRDATRANVPYAGEEIEPAKPQIGQTAKLGGRYVLTPEEVQQAERIQKIAARRASERGMQYAAGMKPSGGKIAAP